MRSIRLPMNPLTFDELAQLARSVIPSVAPQWTDHNTHDPGIMLLELLSWIAEAQMYGIARTRKDERLAFARLLDLAPRGPRPSSGLVWPAAESGPARWPVGYTAARETRVIPDRRDAASFLTTQDIELTTATLESVTSRFADGRVADWTAANTHDGATFMPFGAAPSPGDRLVLAFKGPLIGGASKDSVISIGVQMAGDSGSSTSGADGQQRKRRPPRLTATLTTEDGETPLRVVLDTTEGLLRTGVLLLRIPAAAASTGRAQVSLRSATGGFLRAPRLQQIAVNVLPVQQVTRAFDRHVAGTGLPDQVYVLKERGLIFPFDEYPLVVNVHDGDRLDEWQQVKSFDASGPDDRHFVVDELEGTLQFGNGVNGRVLPAGSTIDVNYSVCEGERGNQPANLSWTLTGVTGPFGTNVVAVGGGADGRGLPDLRRLARQRIRTARPVVTSADLEQAALSFSDLGVTRASELRPRTGCRVRGTRVLLVVGAHDSEGAVTRTESDEFLAEIHARIAPRLALGQRLEVIGPRYVPLRVHASVAAAPRLDPTGLRETIVQTLQSRLAVVAGESGPAWPFGRDVTATGVRGWIRKVAGVARVNDVELSSAGASIVNGVLRLDPAALPLLDVPGSKIAVERSIHSSHQQLPQEARS